MIFGVGDVKLIFQPVFEELSLFIEIIAVAIIVSAVLYATGVYLLRYITRSSGPGDFHTFRHRLGRALLLGLEILVAADVIRTVALEQTIESVVILGLLVVIRTFLSWSLYVEMEGRWPWQQVSSGEPSDCGEV